jgi:DNA adenine methylase
MANPILKWAGGKRQIMDEIIAHFPKDYRSRRFHEPMFGAGAITFKIEPKSGTINDINRRLVNLYKVIKTNPEELIQYNRRHHYDKEYFYKARERFNVPVKGEALDPVEEASLLIYLNRSCFNGLYRENSSGGFNVPFGSYTTVDFVQEIKIHKAHDVLSGLKIHNEDFNYVNKSTKPGDLVYFDRPYHPVSLTASFTSYSKEDFGIKDQERLRDTMTKLHKRGVMVVLSNSDAPEVRALYEQLDGFTITEIKANRAINSNGSKRGEVGELIVTNVPIENRVIRF